MRKITALTIAFIMIFTSFSFALDFNATAKYLEKQKLDEWGILALYSYGKDVKNKTLKKVDASNITTDYEAYIMGAVPKGEDVSSYAKKIIKAQRESGKFADYIDGTGEDLINAHIWGIISLYTANKEGYDKKKALEWLKENQNEDGGFSVFTGMNYSDVDLTAMGLIAYSILGLDKEHEKVKKAINFIEKNIDKKQTCEGVAYYILARTKLGMDIDKNLYNKLLKYQLKDGSFKHLKRASKGNYMATWHGMLAMMDYKNKSSVFTRLHDMNKVKNEKKKVAKK
ncbi:prenyltransferase/squalene oxidase repeat-containing protein [Crassaminicella indica]|uniref:Terpene cyclase/mutase family protein n=1 Tax=Crassaminicella indica TaxID=2855394 RepID=A0ABX8R8C3_9CLOT|nr:prenyltransferase/squalene oxidase repeat-containing protein [Crassaminicella indica]QXM05268.1 terpene cyclase/mutase family protein [Crassaminicella indica]